MEDKIDTEDAPKIPKRSKSLLILISLAVILAGGLTYGGYKIGNDKITKLTHQKADLSTQLTSLQAKTQKQDAINKGIVSDSDRYKDPQGELGQINGKITFTMPQGWERVPTSSCSSRNRDSTVLCYDTAAIAPKDQPKDSKNPYWNANISVFEYKSTDGTAKQWLEKYYIAGTTITDQNINSDDIGGNSALIYQTSQDGAYVDGFYAVVHGSYAVVISTELQYGAVYGTYSGAKPYDYRDTYGPILQQFLGSIKFKDAH